MHACSRFASATRLLEYAFTHPHPRNLTLCSVVDVALHTLKVREESSDLNKKREKRGGDQHARVSPEMEHAEFEGTEVIYLV